MGKKTDVPDVWEDDWETQADKAVEAPPAPAEPQELLSKAERLARHVETNRKLWESAETPQTFHYLEANSNVPLASNFKPQVKVLSPEPRGDPRQAEEGPRGEAAAV
ncbi:hypothetical protein G7046_g9712 [Stylonectria norvegica]|nr:hypothetical protein G7046_g9712 [Stylonectria norvegica]